MAERLAARPAEVQQETEASKAPMDPVFEEIVANANLNKKAEDDVLAEIAAHYDQEIGHPNNDFMETAVTDDKARDTDEWADLAALENKLGISGTTATTTGDEGKKPKTTSSPTALAPAPAAPPAPTAPTPAVPTTPAPTPTPTPAPTTPESRVRINMDATPETTPPDMPPPEAPTLPPVDRREPGTSAPVSEFKLVTIDQSKDVEDFARDAAEARLTRELNTGGFFKRMGKNIWKGNFAREYYRQKYIREAKAEILSQGDLLAHKGELTAAQRGRAMESTIERFQTEYDEMIHGKAGERRDIHEKESPVALRFKDLVRRYANGELTDATLKEKHTEALNELREQYGEAALGKGTLTIDNMLQVAQGVKGAVEHGESLDNVINNMRVITGEARTGARTEARYNWTDKMIQKMERKKITSVAPEGLMIMGTAIASCVARITFDKTLSAALTVASLGLGAGVIAGLREKRRLKEEEVQHARDRATGGEINDAQPTTRRGRFMQRLFSRSAKEMEKVTLNAPPAREFIGKMREKMAALELDDTDLPAGKTREMVIREALDALSVAHMRNEIADTEKKDVLGYPPEDGLVNDQRFEFGLAMAELKVALNNQLDDASRARLATELGLPPTSTLDQIVEGQERAVSTTAEIRADESEKAQARRKLAVKRIAMAGTIGAAVSIVAGTLIHEGVANINDSGSNSLNGAFEGEPQVSADGQVHQTMLEGMLHGDQDPAHHGPSADFQPDTVIGDKDAHWTVTADHEMVKNPDGTFNLVDPNGNATVENMQVNPDGTMPDATRELLESKGMHIEPADVTIPGETHLEPQQVSLQEFVDNPNHEYQTTAVTHDPWMDNDTPAPVFDKNEQGLHWTGTGVVTEPDGSKSYHMNISNMTEGGSYHNGQFISWVEAAQQGKMGLTVWPEDGSPKPYIIPFNPDGSVTIPSDHPAAQFFADRNGHAVPIGGDVEASFLGEVDENGVQHINTLATVVGTNETSQMTFNDMVPVKEPDVIQPGYKIITDGYTTPGTVTEMPPVVPIYGRRPVEALVRRPLPERPSTPERPYAAYGEYGLLTPEIIRRMEEDRMPELRRDPKAKIPLGAGLDWHYSRKMDQDPGYVAEIEAVVATLPKMSGLTNATKAIAPILVKANGEEDNIYNTLALYAQQDPTKLSQTQILLHVNWMDTAEGDPVEKAKIDKTKSEIQRALRDFPQLAPQLSQFETVWEKAKLDAGEYGDRLIGHAAQRMYDVAMFAARQAVQDGRINGDTDDLLILKGDADALGMSRKYLTNMIDTFETHPENDTFTGGVRWGTELSNELPGLGFLTNFIEINRIAAQRAHIKAFQPTFGVNAAVRMSTFGAVGGIGHYSDQNESAPDDLAIGERVASARNAGSATGTAGAGYGAAGANVLGDDHSYHRHVGGASIDTAADRFEAKYVNGESITTIWDKVNQGGHQDRRFGLRKGEKEDLRRKPQEAIGRIEHNMSELMSSWFPNEAQNAAALAVMLPGPDQLGGASAYEIIRRSDGSKKFTFSPEGREWLINRLQYRGDRPIASRRDPYGERQARQLYNRRPPRRQRRSRVPFRKNRTAPMVGGLAFTS